ncbi:hypothetical protein G6F40_015977 [Rhizopus arrhizus]|nr:hypothetical protein G6F40_015977 [Rhizopus arrhizus]
MRCCAACRPSSWTGSKAAKRRCWMRRWCSRQRRRQVQPLPTSRANSSTWPPPACAIASRSACHFCIGCCGGSPMANVRC